MKRYALLTHRQRLYCEDTYVNNDVRYCFKSQSQLIKQEKNI